MLFAQSVLSLQIGWGLLCVCSYPLSRIKIDKLSILSSGSGLLSPPTLWKQTYTNTASYGQSRTSPPPTIGADALDFCFDPLTAWVNVVPVMSSGLLLLGENPLP